MTNRSKNKNPVSEKVAKKDVNNVFNENNVFITDRNGKIAQVVTKPFNQLEWTPVVEVQFKNSEKKGLRALIDSGASHTLAALSSKYFLKSNKSKTNKKIKKNRKKQSWTGCGNSTYSTSYKAAVKFKLPDFSNSKEISWKLHVAKNQQALNGYDMIIGRDLLKKLSMQLDFEKGGTVWDGISVPMQDFRNEGKSNEYNLIFTEVPESEAVNSLN